MGLGVSLRGQARVSLPQPAEWFSVGDGKVHGAGMGLSGLTWGLLLLRDAPVSGSDGMPRRRGVRRVPSSLREVRACGADRVCGREPVWGRSGDPGWGSGVRVNPSHDLSKPGGAWSSFEIRIWGYRIWSGRVHEGGSGLRWGVPGWAFLEAARCWGDRGPRGPDRVRE